MKKHFYCKICVLIIFLCKTSFSQEENTIIDQMVYTFSYEDNIKYMQMFLPNLKSYNKNATIDELINFYKKNFKLLRIVVGVSDTNQTKITLLSYEFEFNMNHSLNVDIFIGENTFFFPYKSKYNGKYHEFLEIEKIMKNIELLKNLRNFKVIISIGLKGSPVPVKILK